jgi:RNA polymerase sigma-70 factor (ECF subfamily)
VSEPTPDDLERWIEAFRGPLIGLCASFGLDWRAAEELAQDVFAEAWLGRQRFRGDPKVLEAAGAWLRGIAFHLCRAGERRAERRSAPLPLELPAPASEDDERRAELVAAFAKLGQDEQLILRVYYLESTSAREVAALLGITPKAVEGRLYQARRALRSHVERLRGHAITEARP